jgi:hypothetical protein
MYVGWGIILFAHTYLMVLYPIVSVCRNWVQSEYVQKSFSCGTHYICMSFTSNVNVCTNNTSH